MVTVRTGPRAEEVRQDAKHSLFVEGRPDALDPKALQVLLDETGVVVRPMGPSWHIRAAAEALHPHHPTYYFLVDRDHQADEEVTESWQQFPDPNTCNLLIWRRRQLESYFLIPEYLAKSEHLRSGRRTLEAAIVAAARSRVFLDAANLTIIQARESLKRSWVDLFTDPKPFDTQEHALECLMALPQFAQKKSADALALSAEALAESFCTSVNTLLGGRTAPSLGCGRWLELVNAKPILSQVISRHFRVRAANGQFLQGRERLFQVVKGLLRLPLSEQPQDFQELYRLMMERTEGQTKRMGGVEVRLLAS